MIFIKDCVELPIRDLEALIYSSDEKLIESVREDKIDEIEKTSNLKIKKEETGL